MKSYLKFFGGDSARAERNYEIISEVRRAESHCVAGFSERRKPTIFEKGDEVFFGRMVSYPNDYIIFGKGIVADSFKLPRDKATNSDVLRIPFRKDWPYYLQMENTIFINGMLSNGITIQKIINEFNNNAFTRTMDGKNWKLTVRQAFSNQSYIEFTPVCCDWLKSEFQNCIDKFGKISEEEILKIPCPEYALSRH